MNWQPIEVAPKDGTVIEARSLDWGKGPGISVYRARWLVNSGIWLNEDNPNEELDYLFEWRETEQPVPPEPLGNMFCPICDGEMVAAGRFYICLGSREENYEDGCGHIR